MEQYPIKQSGNQDLVIEKFRPVCGGLVRGNDEGGALVGLVYEVKEAYRLVFFYREKHNAINDDQVCFN